MRLSRPSIALLLVLASLMPGCSPKADNESSRTPEAAAPVPTNRVDVPAAVRQNLGVTFAKVERRPVARAVRAPGRFELLPDARREYRTMLPGQVEPMVKQFDRVEPGDVIFRINSPKWREIQQNLAGAEAAIRAARASAETIGPLRNAHRVHEQALDESVSLWTDRVSQLKKVSDAGGGKADELAAARATLAVARAELAEVLEKDAELEAREREIASDLAAALTTRELLLAGAAAVTGLDARDLEAEHPAGAPRWRSLDVIESRAVAPGVVETIALTRGAWADESTLVISTVQPDRLRFHAQGLQSDLARFRDGLAASIAPPTLRTGSGDAAMRGTLVVGLGADPEQRTVELFMTPDSVAPWAKPGVAAFLEIALDDDTPDLAIPLSAVVRDGLASYIFRRDPRDPDTVLRIEADLGIDDGRWVIIKSGVREGDEVVLDGVYQLMLATSTTATKGGHFHADGTFHEGED